MKKKLTKKAKLILVNVVIAVIIFLYIVFYTLMSHAPLNIVVVFRCLLVQGIGTFLSLVIYYISILTDVIIGNKATEQNQFQQQSECDKENK